MTGRAPNFAAENMENTRGFEDLFRREYARLCQRAHRITRDLAVAEDLVQDVFVAFWHQEDRASIASPSAYLYRAVINKALSAATGQQRRSELTAQYDLPRSETTNAGEQALHLADLERQLRQAIASLPPMCQRVFLLSRYEEMSHREIADFLDISPNTVDNHIKKALAILRQALLAGLILLFTSW